jgi:hypothetical protein
MFLVNPFVITEGYVNMQTSIIDRDKVKDKMLLTDEFDLQEFISKCAKPAIKFDNGSKQEYDTNCAIIKGGTDLVLLSSSKEFVSHVYDNLSITSMSFSLYTNQYADRIVKLINALSQKKHKKYTVKFNIIFPNTNSTVEVGWREFI